MLLDGDGTKRDIEAGLLWLRRAARRGDAKAQYNLGRTYAYGEDVRKNETYAKKWLDRAARNGHLETRHLLKSVRKKVQSSGAKSQ